MLAQDTCNCLATLSHPPWTEDLTRESYMTVDGEKRIPFHVYVQPGNNIDASSSVAMPQFNQLPQELQLHILAMCCPSTLFQLMHTSASLRIEASKLFWATQDTYFHVSAHWLLRGAYPGCTFSDLAFLPHVQSIEVKYTSGMDNRLCPGDDKTAIIKQDRIARFWIDIQRTFPRVTRIIFNDNGPKPWEDGTEAFSLSLQLLLHACPRHIEVSALCLEEVSQCSPIDARLPKVTWRKMLFTPSAEPGSWNKSEPTTARQTVLMPPRRFSGPVGRFMELQYLNSTKIYLQRHGLWPLIVEAIDRHYFSAGQGTPFTCPFGCNSSFYIAGAWSIHAAENHFHWRRLLEVAPEAVKSMFERRRQELDRKREEVSKRFRELRNQWEGDDGARRSEIKCDWMEQLANETGWETERGGEQNQIWDHFMVILHPHD